MHINVFFFLKMDHLGNLKARQLQAPEAGFTPAPSINEVCSFERGWLNDLPIFRDYFRYKHCTMSITMFKTTF